MPPSGLAILIGAGPTSGAGIARVLASPTQGNLAVALLARNPTNLTSLTASLQRTTPNPIAAFPSSTSPSDLTAAFSAIKNHPSFQGLKLVLAIFHIKHSSRKPFLEETHSAFTSSLEDYIGGAMLFSQLALQRIFADHGDTALSEGGGKKGTIIFTGTLGAMRTSAQYSSYGATRSGTRSLSQGLAKEFSEKGVQVVHVVVNGGVRDLGGEGQDGQGEGVKENVERGKIISAEALGENYLWLSRQAPTCWTHELDMRPAQEKF